jgi:mono/diheme cytochrome c family protein
LWRASLGAAMSEPLCHERRRMRGPLLAACCVWLAVSCSERGALRTRQDSMNSGPADYALPVFCARGASDAVAKLFCASGAANISSLAQLRAQLHLVSAVMQGHTTSLGSHLVSAINPRVILQRAGSLSARDSEFAILAFTRGQQRVELAALDGRARRFNFYLIDFKQACNELVGGCQPGDLFTPAIEANWLELRVRDDELLKNTPEDCRRCHGGGPNRRGPMLLMRELLAPWTHWLREPSSLRDDYLAAKRDPSRPEGNTEAYAGTTLKDVVSPGALEELIGAAERAGLQAPQPLDFPSGEIGFETRELSSSSTLLPGPASRGGQPALSPTWRALYEAFLSGDSLAPPYQYQRATDDDKLHERSAKYQAFLAGTLPQHELPDLGDVFPDDAQRLAELGFAAEPEATGPELLTQVCAACHNAALDPTLTRARFDVELSRMGRAGLENAIARLELPEDDALRMPPAGFRDLDAAARLRLVEYLRSVAH